MTTKATLEEVTKQITDKLDALGASQVTEDRVSEIVRTQLEGLSDDDEFVRKLRFGKGEEDLEGTKLSGLDKADVEFLHATQVGLKGQLKSQSDKERHPAGGTFYEGPSEILENARKRLVPPPELRAMDTAESGFGSQLVGNQYLRELWTVARRESRVMGLIRSFPMTDATSFLPVEVDFPEMLFVSESTANNSANYATSKTGSQRVQVDAKKLLIHQMWSGEMEEDSLVPFVPFLRRQAGIAIAHYGDSVLLNGDTTNAGTGNINLDDADPADTKHYLAFDGIRHAALVDNTGNGKDAAGPVTLGLLSGQRGLMIDSTRFVDWGHPNDAADLVYVCDPETADKIALLDEVVTVDKFGVQATVLNGQVGRILSHPVIVSMAVSKTEADGKVSTTAANNTKGQVVTVNRNGFVVGERRVVRVETERLPATDQTRLVYSTRLGFGRFTPTGAASGIEAAAVLFNITVA